LKHNLETATVEDFATDLLTWCWHGEAFKLTADNKDIWTIRNKYIDATPY
jgi:hypothetical protein